MAEIMQQAYLDPTSPTFGPESGESTRLQFNDVDDYNGWKESPPQNRDGSNIPGYTGWKRKVKVQWADPLTLSTSGSSDTGLKLITVTVTDSNGQSTNLYALRAKNSVYQDYPSAQVTYTSWVGVTAQVGTDSSAQVNTAATPLNQVP